MKPALCVSIFALIIAACAESTDPASDLYETTLATDKSAHQHQSDETPADEAANIQLGDGQNNQIDIIGLSRFGPSLIVPSVMAEADSFLVLHPFKDGAPVQTDYVGSTFIPAGLSESVAVRLDDIPEAGTPFIIMLHQDVNGDQTFQFGDGVTVPDAPVFEGSTLIAKPMQAPEETILSPDIIKNSAQEHHDKAQAFKERADYRNNADMARARALLHSWLAEVEATEKSIDRIEPLLALDFFLNFSSGALTELQQLEEWLLGPASSFEATRHVLHNVSVSDPDDGVRMINAEMHWNGLLPDGGLMKARTLHNWSVVPNADGDFQIKRIDVEILDPFQPTEWPSPTP